MVRGFLDGRFENTAFCLLAPDGKERLSRSGRAPWMAFGRQDENTIAEMEKIAKQYPPKGDAKTPLVQDFHSFKQSLNVASGDQRLLLYVAAEAEQQDDLRDKLSAVLGDDELVGRFHSDFYSKGSDENWAEVIDGEKSKSGLIIIQSDKFGQKGRVVRQLALGAEPKEIKSALLDANQRFAKSEERKVYSEHVSEGHREGVQFDTVMPYGEDRDGDGKIDFRGGRSPRR